MAISLFQKLKLGFRGWSRRRSEETVKRNAEFLAKSTPWAKKPEAAAPPAAAPRSTPKSRFDLEGLQVAYLDDSGRIAHYLDLDSGEVMDVPENDTAGAMMMTASPQRYRRVPQRSAESDRQDRIAFAQTADKPAIRSSLAAAAPGAEEFRKVLAQDRSVERAWYNFKNDRAASAIDRWLAGL